MTGTNMSIKVDKKMNDIIRKIEPNEESIFIWSNDTKSQMTIMLLKINLI